MSAQELAYVILTPHSLQKSRTGGILTRLVTRTGLELAGARMFAPSEELIREYAEAVVSADDPQDRRIQEMIRGYVVRQLGPDRVSGRRRRVMVLLFQGEDATRRVRSVVGNISVDRRAGETIRDTFGDLVLNDDGEVVYFEPAVLAAPVAKEALTKLNIWARYSEFDGGLLQDVVDCLPSERLERTLVLIKPDNFRFPTGRPGNVIDFFSRTGLAIVGIKMHRMSVAQALAFYDPVREILRARLGDWVGQTAAGALERDFGYPLPPPLQSALGNLLAPWYGDHRFESIIRFMAGRTPAECPPDQRDAPGTETSIALVYEGVDAVRKIREVLGPTDPSKAPPGSIRREFGQSVMINAAHASDSAANAEREIQIVNVAENDFIKLVDAACP